MLFLALALTHVAQAAPTLSPSQAKDLASLSANAGEYHLVQNSVERPCLFQEHLQADDAVRFDVSVVNEASEFRRAGDIVGELTFGSSDGSRLSLFDRSAFIGVNLGSRRSLGGGVLVTHNAAWDESNRVLTESSTITALSGSEEAVQTVRFSGTGMTYDYVLIDRNAVGFTTKTIAEDHCEFRRRSQ